MKFVIAEEGLYIYVHNMSGGYYARSSNIDSAIRYGTIQEALDFIKKHKFNFVTIVGVDDDCERLI
jgi:hypothetical protein